MRIWVRPLRFHFRATDPIIWTDSGPTNVLRGALGLTLRDRSGCHPTCSVQGLCVRSGRAVCAYRRIFAPHRADGPSGFADPPRPFVIRAALSTERTEPGRVFHFDVHVFERDPSVAETIADCLAEIGRRGFGPSRGRARLERVELLFLNGRVAECCGELPHWRRADPWPLPWEAAENSPDRLRVQFVTPTELKAEGRAVREAPGFAALVARARDRVSTLSLYYGEPVDEFDYRGLVQRARCVRMIDSRLEFHNAGRFSTRTRRSHTLGGFTGCALYEGPVGESLGLLRAAYWTGVGRQTVWGHGAVIATPG